LFLLADMQKALEQHRAVIDEDLFPGINHFVPSRPNLRGDQIVHTHNQNVLVMRAVKDTDVPTAWSRGMNPPQKVVVKFLGARRLEGDHLAALRIDPAHDRTDGPILSRSVHPLQNQEDGSFSLSCQTPGKVSHFLGIGFDFFSSRLFVKAFGPDFGGDFRQATGCSRFDLKGQWFHDSFSLNVWSELPESGGPLG
jgi:hypothetical protein